MTKEEREKLTNARACGGEGIAGKGAEVERVKDADIIPAPVTYEGLPDDIRDRIETATADYCLYICSPPVDDLRKEKQLFFSSVCSYVGKKINKSFTYPKRHGDGGRWNAVNLKALENLIPVYMDFCGRYNKIPTIYSFMNFSGLSYDWFLDDNAAYVTPERVSLLQKIRKIEFSGIKEGILDGSRNPTGGIAILNNEYWQTSVAPAAAAPALSAASLPVLGDPLETDAVLIDEKPL